MRRTATFLILAALAFPPFGALAQIPAGPGQQPGTLPPAPPVIPPPPLAIPAPVPPSATLQPPPAPGMSPPSGTYRVPSAGSGSLNYTIRSERPPKQRIKKKWRKYRGSALMLVRQV